MFTRKASIVLLLVVVISIITTIYTRGNVSLYSTYVNKYISQVFHETFPNMDIKISDTVVKKNKGLYKVYLAGILVKDSDGTLIGKIPKIEAIIKIRYFFSKFTIKKLTIDDPYIVLPTSIASIEIHDLITHFTKSITQAQINNLTINKSRIDEIYSITTSQQNTKVLNINIKKDQNSSIQLEIKEAHNTIIAARFFNIQPLWVSAAFKKYNISCSGTSLMTLDESGRVITGAISINKIKGTVLTNKTIHTITSGHGLIGINNNVLTTESLIFSMPNQDISIVAEYSLDTNSMSVTAKTDSLDVQDLLKLWPHNQAMESRRWFETHIISGNFTHPKIIISRLYNKQINIGIDSDFSHGQLSTELLFAPIIDISGHFSIQNDNLNINFTNARLNNIELKNCTVQKNNIYSDEATVIHGLAKSTAQELYPFLTSEYLNIIKKETINGIAKTEFSIEINDAIEHNIHIILSDVNSESFLNTFNIQDGAFNIILINGILEVHATALANNEKIMLHVKSDADITRSHLQGRLNTSDFAKLNPTYIESLSGYVDVNIDSTYIDEYQYITGKIDISDTQITIPTIDWNSKPGEYGSIDFDLIQSGESISIPTIIINTDTEQISAIGYTHNITIEKLVLEKKSLNQQQLNFTYTNNDNEEQLFLYGDKVTINNTNADNKINQNLTIRGQVKEMILNNNIPIFDVKIQTNPNYHDSYMLGRFNPDYNFIIENNQDIFIIRANEAGLFLSAFGITDSIEHGTLLLHYSTTTKRGVLLLKQFFLIQLPVLAQILSLGSLQGVVHTLNNEGIYFDQLLLPFTYHDGTIIFDESWLESLSLGISVQGTVDINQQKMKLSGGVVPLYYINKLIWRLPIIGKLLTGGKGRGVISIDYKLATQENGENKVSVNTISIFAPKLLQRLLEIFKYH